ncbi:MAG: circadian clock protein KaiC [Spirochaetales bacterium]|nr:circadian clock protein KaiC [Spirochaetales bacterium]
MKSNKPKRSTRKTSRAPALRKSLTGIQGLDELTGGGLPKGRSTLVCGGPGSGKTLLAMEFLVHGAIEFSEPGVFVGFEEKAEALAQNFVSLGFDLNTLVAQKRLAIDCVSHELSEISESGEYDLGGLFIRLEHAIGSIGAGRVVIDGIDQLFSGLTDMDILRAELQRLFLWLKTKGVTAIVTAEQGEGDLTRHGLEEYAADCVILLDHRVTAHMSTRRLRVVKYRGSSHSTNELPFLIDESGVFILPVTATELKYPASTERVSSGIPRLDAMMGGGGYRRGSTVLVSGSPGTGKTTLAAHFARAAVAGGERCLWLASEEAPIQIIRNMGSIGIDLAPAAQSGLLRLQGIIPTTLDLETHLLNVYRLTNEFAPQRVIMDSVSNFVTLGREGEIKTMLMQLTGLFKTQRITSLFTSLMGVETPMTASDIAASSLMDTWLVLREIQSGAERNRILYLLKSRGMAHSNQIREFLLTDSGVELRDVYVGPSGDLLTGSALLDQKAREQADTVVEEQEAEARKRELQDKRRAMVAQIAALRAAFDIERIKARTVLEQDEKRATVLTEDRVQMAEQRRADAVEKPRGPRKHNSGGTR